jgi:hypothetical protein
MANLQAFVEKQFSLGVLIQLPQIEKRAHEFLSQFLFLVLEALLATELAPLLPWIYYEY